MGVGGRLGLGEIVQNLIENLMDGEPAEVIASVGKGVRNTGQFDVSGHPAISVPSGAHDGLPVGAMLVGRHFEESTLYRLAECVFPEVNGGAGVR